MSSNECPTSSPVPPNVDDVVKILKQKSSKWAEVGLGLGVGLDFLEQQSHDVAFGSPEMKLAVIIGQWLESHCSEVTWNHLIEVLREMKLHDTANHVISWLLTDDKAQKKYHWKMLPGYPQDSLINNPQSVISENETVTKRIAPPSVDLTLQSEIYSDEATSCHLSCTSSDGSVQCISCTVFPPSSIPGAVPIPCIVSKSFGITSGKYSIRFTPLVSGIHKLKLQLNGKDIDGLEPFKIPVGLRRNPRLITDLNYPWMTRVLNDGTLVITECAGHCIMLHNMVARCIGSKGQGLGELSWPCGLAITPEGTMIVADNGNHRVQELAMDGSYKNHFGEKGDNNGEFNEPKGITIDSTTGLVYVAEIGNHRIQVFTRDFKYCNTIGNSGSAPGQFDKPYNTVFDSQGFLYVTDYGNHRIQKFTRDGRFVLEFGKKGSDAGQLKHPVGITIDDEDQLYITERHNHRVSMFTSTGQFKGCFGQQGDSQTCFNEPYGILFANGRLYVNDCSNNRVCIY